VIELVDHLNSAFFWILDYLKKNHIPVDKSMVFHIRRLKVLLDELNNPPSLQILSKIHPSDDSYHPDSSDEDLTEPRGSRFTNDCLLRLP